MPVSRNPALELMLSGAQRKELGQFIYKVRNSRPFFIADFWKDGALIGGCMASGQQYLHITYRAEVEPCVVCHSILPLGIESRVPVSFWVSPCSMTIFTASAFSSALYLRCSFIVSLSLNYLMLPCPPNSG